MGILLLGIRPICQIKHHNIGAQMGRRPARNINTMVRVMRRRVGPTRAPARHRARGLFGIKLALALRDPLLIACAGTHGPLTNTATSRANSLGFGLPFRAKPLMLLHKGCARSAAAAAPATLGLILRWPRGGRKSIIPLQCAIPFACPSTCETPWLDQHCWRKY